MSKKTLAGICILCFVVSTYFFWQQLEEGKLPETKVDGQDFGKLCVSQVFPAISQGVEKEEIKVGENTLEKSAPQEAQPAQETTEAKQETTGPKKTKKKKKKKADNSKPQVIIYHTHSTESYQPFDGSNFHRTKEEGTVRDVGNQLTKELNRQGIGVVHDKTIHDRPSYNESYTRSLETVTALQRKYPTAKYIIDLHRDAAAYAGNVGKTTRIDGETVAQFSLVVGQDNANFEKLMNHAKKVSKRAEAMYPGFGGRIIKKEYRYNEYIADKCLLLEIGNNQNQIEEVRKTGKYFARVLASIIEEER